MTRHVPLTVNTNSIRPGGVFASLTEIFSSLDVLSFLSVTYLQYWLQSSASILIRDMEFAFNRILLFLN